MIQTIGVHALSYVHFFHLAMSVVTKTYQITKPFFHIGNPR